MLVYEELLDVLGKGRTAHPDLFDPALGQAPRYMHYEKRGLPLVRAALRKAQIYVLSVEAQLRARRFILWEPARLWEMLQVFEMPFDMVWVEEAPAPARQVRFGYLIQRQPGGFLVSTYESSRNSAGNLCISSGPVACRFGPTDAKLWDSSPLARHARDLWPQVDEVERRLQTPLDVPGPQSWLAFSAVLHDTWLSILEGNELQRTVFDPQYELSMTRAFGRMRGELPRFPLVPVGIPVRRFTELILGKGNALKAGGPAAQAWSREGLGFIGECLVQCWVGLALVLFVSAETGIDLRARPSAPVKGRGEERRSSGGIVYRHVTVDPDKPRVAYLPDDEGDDNEAEDSRSKRALHQVRGTWMVHPTKRGNPDCTDWCEPAVWTDSRGKFRRCRRCGKEATWRMPHARGDSKLGEVVRIRNVKPSV